VELDYRFNDEIDAESAEAAERVVNGRIIAAAHDENWLLKEIESATATATLAE
jgi:hypothetical protein